MRKITVINCNKAVADPVIPGGRGGAKDRPVDIFKLSSESSGGGQETDNNKIQGGTNPPGSATVRSMWIFRWGREESDCCYIHLLHSSIVILGCKDCPVTE